MLAPVLSIQSHVVYGHVGNAAAVFPLQRLRRDVWPLMSVQFSSHAGYSGWRGRAFDGHMIDECTAGLAAIRAANPGAAYACDPVIGDVGRGAYVAPGVAEFFRDRALPSATIATPNAFELEWLTGASTGTLDEARAAVAALRARGPNVVVITSLSLDDASADALDTLAGDDQGVWRLRTPKLPIAVNGAGDLFAALFFHHWLERGSTPEALSRTASSVFGIVAATFAAGQRELALVTAQDELVRPSQVFAAEAV